MVTVATRPVQLKVTDKVIDVQARNARALKTRTKVNTASKKVITQAKSRKVPMSGRCKLLVPRKRPPATR